MQIFIDSADVREIREAAAMGVIDGCTTNPSLVAKVGRKLEEVIPEICTIVDGPVSAEVISTDAEGMIREGRELAKIHKNVVVKIPLIADGLKAVRVFSAEVISTDAEGMIREGRELAKIHKNVVVKIPLIADGLKAVRVFSAEGIKTNVTLCFSPMQAMLAAKAGATYISPFVGRLDDIQSDGMELIEQIVTIYENYGFDTQVLVASVRSPMHLVQSALIGAHCATVPFNVIAQLLKHPLTDKGLEQFLADAKKNKG
jgi:transaldolase